MGEYGFHDSPRAPAIDQKTCLFCNRPALLSITHKFQTLKIQKILKN